MDRRFEVKEDFYHNGNTIKIISGGMHYFRIVPDYWRDRLEKLKAMGCNTVETYVPWNMHEPKKGQFDFTGILNIKRFIDIANELDLFVIVRPSPYICAEWEFGGLPGWLLKEDDMRVRSSSDSFMGHVKDYYKVLFQILSPLQYPHGGPIIMMQVENEYGYYGDDTKYLEELKDMMIENGTVVPLVTSDGPWGDALNCGSLEGVLPTANFGSKVEEQFRVLRKYTNGPLMCMEFWVGWFDNWGGKKHNTSDLEQNCKDLEDALRLGHLNIYMFIGGTNFGFMNGSNYYDVLTPDVTSYDYDAVLTESGDITKKYIEFQKIISKYVELPVVSFSTNISKKAYGRLDVIEQVSLFRVLENISDPIYHTYPLSMEKLDQNYGYTLYVSRFHKENTLDKLRLWDAGDRAIIFVDEKQLVTLYDRELLNEVVLKYETNKNSTLMILTENMGRVNFGPYLDKQRKGIDGMVQINGHIHTEWNHYPLPLDNVETIDFTKGYNEGVPAFYKFKLELNEASDTYINMEGWGKGCVFINGFNLGRFWNIGPQKRLYLPAPLLKMGSNEIIVFETEGKVKESIILESEPDLG